MDRLQHYDLCDGLGCPCYQEGSEVLAVNHREMVEWFAKRAPHMLVEALASIGYRVTPPIDYSASASSMTRCGEH